MTADGKHREEDRKNMIENRQHRGDRQRINNRQRKPADVKCKLEEREMKRIFEKKK